MKKEKDLTEAEKVWERLNYVDARSADERDFAEFMSAMRKDIAEMIAKNNLLAGDDVEK